MGKRRLKRYLEDPNASIPKRTLSRYRHSTPVKESEYSSSDGDEDTTLQESTSSISRESDASEISFVEGCSTATTSGITELLADIAIADNAKETILGKVTPL